MIGGPVLALAAAVWLVFEVTGGAGVGMRGRFDNRLTRLGVTAILLGVGGLLFGATAADASMAVGAAAALFVPGGLLLVILGVVRALGRRD